MRRREFLSALVGGATVAGGLAAAIGPFDSAWAGPAPAGLGEIKAMLNGEKGIIYSISQQRVWAVDKNFRVIKTHRVSGRYGAPPYGLHRVYSKALHTAALADPNIQWNYMVRFYRTKNENNIGFHEIPVRCNEKKGTCAPVQ